MVASYDDLANIAGTEISSLARLKRLPPRTWSGFQSIH